MFYLLVKGDQFMKKIIIFIILIFITEGVSSPIPIGKLVAFEGKVIIYHKDDIRGFKVIKNYIDIFTEDVIKTKSNSTALLRLNDKSKVVLTEKSIIEIPASNNINIIKGEILFNVTRQEDIHGLQILTEVATIGVKGTVFAVIANNNTVNIFLKSGKLEISPKKGKFKKIIQRRKGDFKEYLNQQQNDFHKYKSKMEKSFYEYMESVTINAGTAISINQNNIRNIRINKELEEKFKLLEQF